MTEKQMQSTIKKYQTQGYSIRDIAKRMKISKYQVREDNETQIPVNSCKSVARKKLSVSPF